MVVPFEQVLDAAKSYLPQLNEKRLREAHAFAVLAHKDQFRKSGEPYVTHPVAAAYNLTKLHVDEDTLVACLLHDVPEDTEYTLEDVEQGFGEKVRFLVEGITKLSKVHYRNNMEERQIESLKKLFIHCAEDPRTILIKLADRMHNMTTLDAVKPEKRERIARETLEIFVPIANLLGIWEFKSQLEDLCFKALDPSEYNSIRLLVKETHERRERLLKESVDTISSLLEKRGLKNVSVEGRKKSFYSIYKKMVSKGRSFKEIYDLIGLRVIVDEVGDCYLALGILHQEFTLKPGRLKDYIAMPKSNGYQSLHTTVFGLGGAITEIQIRTKDIHLEVEYGVAAHYFYNSKQAQEKAKKRVGKQSQWVKRILDMQREMESNKNFLAGLKLDVFKDRIFVFTPKGDVVDLPRGASVIDFAYHIHSDVGHGAESALINGHQTTLYKDLKTGDIVEVITNSSSNPRLEWINHAQSNLARNKIREFLKQQDKARLMNAAGQMLEKRLAVFGLEKLKLEKEQMDVIARLLSHKNWDALLLAIGRGHLNVAEVISVINAEQHFFGETHAPENASAYVRGHRLLAPSEVYNVHFLIECDNRVGMLRDVSLVLANFNINILWTRTWHCNEAKVSNLEFSLEIEDLAQYERVVRALKHVLGVRRVIRLQSGDADALNQAALHKEPVQ